MGIAFGGYDKSDDWYRGNATIYLESKLDPRWNWSKSVWSIWGHDDEYAEQVEKFKKLYGDPPADLSYGAIKD